METLEMWKDIPQLNGRYQVSNIGRVRSMPSRTSKGKLLKATINPQYRRFTYHEDGKSKLMYVHDAVLAAFHGPKPEGMLARHLDDDKLNNLSTNLTYGTVSENSLDSVRNGTHRMVRR